jgi:hypothetical protein
MRALLLVALLGFAACTSQVEMDAAREGEERAAADIAEGTPCLLFLGLPSPSASPLDPETGLPRYSRGCVISDESTTYVGAYNDAIRRALREGRLAGMTFREKATTRESLQQRFRGPDVHRLAFRGAPLDAPGGRFRVEDAPRHHPQAPNVETPYLFVTDLRTGVRRELHYVPLGLTDVDVAFADEGTTLLVSAGAGVEYRTFDLPHALLLQVFPAAGE